MRTAIAPDNARGLRPARRSRRGVTTLEVVMIVGVSALILSVIVLAFPTIKKFFVTGTKTVINNTDLNDTSNPLE